MEMYEIIKKWNKKLTKFELFSLIYDFKFNLEINASSINPGDMYALLCDTYADNSPLYQNENYSNNIDYTKFDNIVIVRDILTDENTNYPNKILSTKYELVKQEINELFILAEQTNTIYIFEPLKILTEQERVNLFTNKIIPINVVLPIEYVYKTYISSTFYNDKLNKYYKVSSDRKFVVELDPIRNTILQKPNQSIINSDCVIVSDDVYTSEINKLLKKIHG